jgi:hypothetical protein
VTAPAKTAAKTPAGKGAAPDKSQPSAKSPAKSPATKSPAPAKSATPEPPKKS